VPLGLPEDLVAVEAHREGVLESLPREEDPGSEAGVLRIESHLQLVVRTAVLEAEGERERPPVEP